MFIWPQCGRGLLERRYNGFEAVLKNESRRLYVAGHVGEMNVLTTVAASVHSHWRPVACMSRPSLLKFWGEVGKGRVHLEDTFSVPLGSFQSGWPPSRAL